MKKILLAAALLGVLLPLALTLNLVGGVKGWQGVLPKGATDSLYYYARIKEVKDGYPFIGNPYIYEYREGFSPAFFVPDILSALPLLAGLPFNLAVAFNMFLWSLVLLLIAYTLMTRLGLPRRWALASTLLTFLTSYSFMTRPTIMQLVYPAFFGFLLLLLNFLRDPLNRKKGIWLALMSASTFYLYSYLSYFVFFVYALVLLWFVLKRQFQELRALILSGAIVAALLIPFALITWLQMGDPYYLEVLSRIGLVHTHLPSIDTLFFARWVVLGLIIIGLIKYFYKRNEPLSEEELFFLVTGLSLLAVLYLNLATGLDLTLAVHVGRFITVWLSLVILPLIFDWWSTVKQAPDLKKYFVALLIFLLGVGAVRNIPRGLSFFQYDQRGDKIAFIQGYTGPLNWLEEHIAEPSVIWADESISEYVPIMTKHYVLFHHSAALHNISDHELQDRYLLSRSLGTTSVEQLKKELGYYAGAGPLKYQAEAINRKVTLCQNLSRVIHLDCPDQVEPVTLLGEEYFADMYQRFQLIKGDQKKFLNQYHVEYLIIDRERNETPPITKHKALYDDGRFVILSLPL